MAMISKATTSWQGGLLDGSGNVTTESGAVRGASLSWKKRTEDRQDGTNPEELLAAAHASCFSMAFAARLAKNNTPARNLEVTARVTFDKVDAGFKVVSSAISVTGDVPGVDAAAFQRIAEDAKDNCPISVAIKGNVQLSVEAKLA